MGYSTSAAVVILFIALASGATVLGPDLVDATRDISNSYTETHQDFRMQQNADFNITNTTFSNSGSTLDVTLENTGTEPFQVEYVDFLADGVYVEPSSTDVNGDTSRTFVAPGETMNATLDLPSANPDRLVVTIETGLSKSTNP